MAKRRSKKERILAESKRKSGSLPTQILSSKAGIGLNLSTQKSQKAGELDYLQGIFGYDPKLIFKDLKKTMFIFIFVLLILLVIALLYT
jgi:hypothetical protein